MTNETLDPERERARLARLAKQQYCYVTTRGRVTGRPHKIEIWFALRERTIYLLSGGGEASDWVKNMHREPQVTVRIGRHRFPGAARFGLSEEEESFARHALAAKYQGWREGRRMSNWARTGLPVAIDLSMEGDS
jgi:deazaflavin-dependent oxidoreductase (nitroreductase family)